jgi:hypothetical protein
MQESLGRQRATDAAPRIMTDEDFAAVEDQLALVRVEFEKLGKLLSGRAKSEMFRRYNRVDTALRSLERHVTDYQLDMRLGRWIG